MQLNAEIVFLEIRRLYTKFLIYRYVHFLTYFFSLHQMTPLHLAAEGARIKILKYFISQEVTDICIQDYKGVICDHACHC